MSFLEALPPQYRVILCDIWGVVHDGVDLYSGAADRLLGWAGEGRRIILITNAPRTAEAVEQQLGRIGLPRGAWHGISTSGEAGIAALNALGAPVGFIGTTEDCAIIESRGVMIASSGDFTDLACLGLDGQRTNVADYLADIEPLAARGVVMHCLNPDRMVIRGGVPEACAGAIADLYEGLGGTVRWYGKPHPAIYDHALALGGNPDKSAVLAIGDALPTDVLGAARQGLDCIFVTGGIHAGEPFPASFAPQYGLGDWAPVAVVATLG
ncbi:TIGR01459 family HAD-type hydrolase [Sphingomonas sp.]|uniref:TIGR01459 family HAD-type hydrolase n=1 Tax=Sphingomonas sp. TaxID=28214 RepID=UPI00286C6335|nr:TIGR01459 family HAD-type hydrolase [Sphingomonas sp.]